MSHSVQRPIMPILRGPIARWCCFRAARIRPYVWPGRWQRFGVVETIGFDYGQRHQVEMTCRDDVRAALADCDAAWRGRLGPDHVVDLAALGAISETALTRDQEIAMRANGLPSTFVPGRNLVFFTFAAALASRRGIKHLIGGMCETDYSGYPDCRDDTLKALQVTLNLGMDERFVLHTPLMWIDKAATWALALELGGQAAGRYHHRADTQLLSR